MENQIETNQISEQSVILPFQAVKQKPSFFTLVILIFLILVTLGLTFYLIILLTNQKQSVSRIKTKAQETFLKNIDPKKTITIKKVNNVNKFSQAVVMIVNDIPVSGEEFSLMANSIYPNHKVSENPQFMKNVVDSLVIKVILEKEAEDEGILITEEEVTSKIRDWLKDSPPVILIEREKDPIWRFLAKIILFKQKVKEKIKEKGLDFDRWLEEKINEVKVEMKI